MKKFVLIFVSFLFLALPVQAEWLAALVTDVDPGAVEHAVVVDGAPEVIVPRALSVEGTHVLFWDISAMDTAHFEIWAIDDHGRRSVVSAPFDLRPAPSVPMRFRIVLE